VPPERCAVTIHHHISTFHTEHCVYAAHLSDGRDWRSCGRPCDHHRIALRDRVGNEHPVIVDVGCRNTIFNARAQSAASLVPRLIEAGVRRLRVEFVWEDGDTVTDVLTGYRDLLGGRLTPARLLARIDTHEQFGVTPGTMRTLQE
jgi:putative protease